MTLQIVSTIVLARLLLPEDFGLVAMVTAMVGFASIFVDLGTRDAVAQSNSLTDGEVSALFWITFGVGLALTGATLLSAAFIARFYSEPRLAHVAMTMSLTFVLPALYFQHFALMRRALMFRTLALIEIASNALATAAALVLAYLDFGYWALVWKTVLSPVFVCAGVWLTCGWWPRRPTFTSGVKDLLRFGLNICGFTLTDYVARSADRVALGYATGPRELGFYQNAFVVYDNPLAVFVGPLHNVATVTLTRLRDDLTALKQAWSSALSTLAYFAAPVFATLAVTGQDLIVLLLGVKWAPAGAILSVLALRGPAHVVERTLGWLHIAAERPDRWRRWGVVNCFVFLLALACGLPFGAMGVAIAYTVITYIVFVPAVVYAGEPFGVRAPDVLKTVGPQVGTALFAASVGFLAGHTVFAATPSLARLLILGTLCVGVYLVIMTFLFRVRKPWAVAASVLRRRRSRVGQ